MSVKDIAYYLGRSPEELQDIISNQPDDELTIAYRQGQMRTKIMLRYDALMFAISGSPDATKEMQEHYLQQVQSEDNA